jgi:hypothetical protein
MMLDKCLEDTIASLKKELEAARRNERRLQFIIIDSKKFVDALQSSDPTNKTILEMQAYLAKEL